MPGNAVKRPWTAAILAWLAGIGLCHAQNGLDKAKAATFDSRMFTGPPGRKAYACFVRRYDASHLAQHPKQKVSAMTLLVTAEDKTVNYSFRLALIRLERIRIRERNKADEDAGDDLVAGTDDKIFRVDRADLHECSELVTDRKELAALGRK